MGVTFLEPDERSGADASGPLDFRKTVWGVTSSLRNSTLAIVFRLTSVSGSVLNRAAKLKLLD